VTHVRGARDAERDDRAQDEAIEASFPSSDPPSWTRLHAGSPNTLPNAVPARLAPAAGTAGPGR
jgi:hypothetical protein